MKKAIHHTVIPLDYDPKGFNEWSLYIRDQVHTKPTVIALSNAVIQMQSLIKQAKNIINSK